MNDVTNTVLGDLLFVLMIALPVALGIFALMRRRIPPVLQSGLVITQPYNALDLVVAAILILHFEMVCGTQLKSGSASLLLFAGKATSTSQEISVMLFQIMYSFGLCALLLVYLKRARGLDPINLFGWNRFTLPESIGRAVLVFIPVLVVIEFAGYYYQNWIKHVLGQPAPNQDIVETFSTSSSNALRILIAVTAVVTAPVMEEMIFRGFLYPVIKRHTDRWFALAFTAILFGAIHGNLLSLVPLAIFAVGLTLAYEWTGCLRVPMLMHATLNSLTLINLSK